MIASWWTRIEGSPRFGGARRYVEGLLGHDVTVLLESAGILRQVGVARTLPCDVGRGSGCLREIVAIGGDYHGVCGNLPRECPDTILSAHDAALLALDIDGLCRGVGAALGLRGTSEAVRDLSGVHRVGAIVTRPGLRHQVFLVIRQSAQGYSEAQGALVSRQKGAPFAMLVPTDRFLTDGMERQASSADVVILTLSDILKIDGGRLIAAIDTGRLSLGLGQSSAAAFYGKGAIVAQALICDGKSPPCWHDLDDRQYQDLVSTADKYDVFADERRHSVLKAGTKNKVPDSYFSTVRAALTSAGYYDPNTTGPDLVHGKQIFQKARAAFDIKIGSSWRLFESVRHEEGYTVYILPAQRRCFLGLRFPAQGNPPELIFQGHTASIQTRYAPHTRPARTMPRHRLEADDARTGLAVQPLRQTSRSGA